MRAPPARRDPDARSSSERSETMGDARRLFDRLTDALNDHDLEAVASGYAPDVEVTSPDGTFQGRDQATAMLASYFTAFPDMRVTTSAKLETGDMVADEWILTGTNTGPIETPDGRTIAPTGKGVSLHGADVGTVEGGLVTSHRIYWDQLEFLTQLGLLGQEVAG